MTDNTIYKCGECGKKAKSQELEELMYAWKCSKCGADRDSLRVAVDPSRHKTKRA